MSEPKSGSSTDPQHIQHQLTIPEDMAQQRLDQVLANLLPDYSRARLQVWIKKGWIKINQKTWRPRDKVSGGEHIIIDAILEPEQRWHAQPIDLDIIYEDESLLIINKPVGLVVHPAIGNRDSTLVNALLHHAPELDALPRAGIVHRLDKDTSGLLVVARTLATHTSLVSQLQARSIKREYAAIVSGALISGGTIAAPIGRHPIKRKLMAVVHSGKEAITHYHIAERFRAHTLLRVQLETGRTHQIRVHMAHIKHPILGDKTYGGRPRPPKGCSDELREALQQFSRQALHAQRLALQHPAKQTLQAWQAPLPDDIQAILALLREDQTTHGE